MACAAICSPREPCVATADQRLELVQVQPHPVLTACDLGGIRVPTRDGRDHDRVPSFSGRRCQHHHVADVQCGVVRQPFIYRDATMRVWRSLLRVNWHTGW